MPTIIRIQPTVEMSTPLTSVVTAKARIAPTAMRNMLAPIPMLVFPSSVGSSR
jgi:hypothetical protein